MAASDPNRLTFHTRVQCFVASRFVFFSLDSVQMKHRFGSQTTHHRRKRNAKHLARTAMAVCTLYILHIECKHREAVEN